METSPESTGQTLFDPTLFAADTHASLSVCLADGLENQTHDTYGRTYEKPLARFDRVSQSWKTSEDISLWGDFPSLATLPSSGMTQSGELFQQPPWEPITAATGYLSLPTPQARDYKGPSGRSTKTGRAEDLPYALGGSPNPTFVEWLMGFPLGWTDLEDSETPSCHK